MKPQAATPHLLLTPYRWSRYLRYLRLTSEGRTTTTVLIQSTNKGCGGWASKDRSGPMGTAPDMTVHAQRSEMWKARSRTLKLLVRGERANEKFDLAIDLQ